MNDFEAEVVDIKPVINLPSPCASPLREVSPDKAGPSALTLSIPSSPDIKPTTTRFTPRTSEGDRQCTNCGEVDTPQWRGTLCNACALWKRSRGADRPLPLLFPVRKRPRSPTPEDMEKEEPEMQGPAKSHWAIAPPHVSPMHARSPVGYRHHARCGSCGQGAALWPNGRPACEECEKALRQNAMPVQPGQSKQYPADHRSRPTSSASVHPPSRPRIITHGHGAPTPTSISARGTPATKPGHRLPLAYYTPISPLNNSNIPPHFVAPILPPMTSSGDTKGKGRHRAATVSGNGTADERAHPTAKAHLRDSTSESRSYELSPSPSASRLDGESGQSSIEDLGVTSRERLPGRRRSTVSGSTHIVREVMPSREEFMQGAAWLYGVLVRTERLLKDIGVANDLAQEEGQ